MVCSLSSVGREFHEQAVMSRVLLGGVRKGRSFEGKDVQVSLAQ